MKKMFTTVLLFLALSAGVFAQSANDLYKMSSNEDAEFVLKALTMELHLDATQQSNVKGLLEKSALSQREQLKRVDANDARLQEIIVTRQTNHIETNLKALIGEAKYAQYEVRKEKIAEEVGKLKD